MTSPREQAPDRVKASKDLDEALEETFPASDPIAVAPKRAGKDDKRIDATVRPEALEGETTDAKTATNMAKFHRVFERRRR
jgi:hypothetical protein